MKKLIQSSSFLLSAIFLLAFLLRVFHLSHESIWLDEGISIAMAKLSVSDMFNKLLVDSMPPLHYLLLHYWITVFGDGEFSVRFLSLLFSMATIAFSYLLAKKLFNEKVALWLAFFLAVSVFHIEYAQETRNYSMIAFFSVSSLYFLVRWKEKHSLWNILFFVLSCLLLLYTHILGVFWVMAFNLYFVLSKYWWKETSQISLKTWVGSQLVILLFFAPWIKIFFAQSASWNQNSWMPLPSLRDILATSTTYAGSYFLLLIFGILFLKSLDTFKENKSRFIFTTFFLIIPTLLLLLSCFLLDSIYLQKYTIASSLFFFILSALGMERYRDGKIQRWILICFLFATAIKLYDYYSVSRKEQWRQAVEHVEERAVSGDVVLVDAGYCIKNAYEYYAKRKDVKVQPLVRITEELNEQNIEQLDEWSGNEIWLVLSHSRDAKGLVKKKIARSFKVLEHQVYLGVEVYKLK